jgi:hypothetical protein
MNRHYSSFKSGNPYHTNHIYFKKKGDELFVKDDDRFNIDTINILFKCDEDGIFPLPTMNSLDKFLRTNNYGRFLGIKIKHKSEYVNFYFIIKKEKEIVDKIIEFLKEQGVEWERIYSKNKWVDLNRQEKEALKKEIK